MLFRSVGDAVCRLDPLFGQGMSVIAKQAKVLEDTLTRNPDFDFAKSSLTLRMQRKLTAVSRTPWRLACNEIFRYPQVKGKRPIYTPFMQWYAARIFYLSEYDGQVYQAFLCAMNLVAPLHSLFAPWLLLRVLGSLVRSRRN